MHYGRDIGVFVIFLDDMTTRCSLRLSVNEAEKLRDAVTLYLADMAPPVPDEPVLITGEA
jgi:hypothetical protein